MKFSYNWITELVDGLDLKPHDLERLITMKTAECEGIEEIGALFTGASTARIVSVEPIPGGHNARNATAALAVALELGAAIEPVVEALGRFGGVARRFQFRGEAGGVTVVDDYAHNPGKVRAVLEAARHGGWGRVVCVFQPHLYSRTAVQGCELGAALYQQHGAFRKNMR